MIFTFYSYKGGVGRTMALANVAELLYQKGLKVLMVDFDLEAPGLERFFDVPEALYQPNEVIEQQGVIDLLLSYKELRSLPLPNLESEKISEDLKEGQFSFPVEPIANFIVPLYEENKQGGSLFIISAGGRSKEKFSEYAQKIHSFDWNDFYDNYNGEQFFEWFRKEIVKLADVVLIDSRTGVTEMGGVCTYQLADVVVLFVAPNDQNIDGTLKMAQSLSNRELVEKGRKGRDLSLVIVPSRVDNAENDLLDSFQKDFYENLDKFISHKLKFQKSAFIDLKIPYNPGYSYKEKVAVRQLEKASASDLSEAYKNLNYALCKLAGLQTATVQKNIFGRNIVCPYKGLEYFDCNDQDPKYFFGREKLTLQLIDRIRQSNFLAILGASGSGKSSVLRAGLLHQLKLGQKLASSQDWEIKIMVPGEHPLQNLALSWLKPDLSDIERASQLDQIESLLKQGGEGLQKIVQASKANQVILVIDQFEEVFTLCRDLTERETFFQCLLEAVSKIDNKLCLILAMQIDFFGKCFERKYSGLGNKIQDQNNFIVIPAMEREELEEVIIKPAEKVNLSLESGLAEQILNDIEGSPGSLPLLQYTLTELWKRREDNQLKFKAYSQLGGIGGTLNRRATDVYNRLTPVEQDVAQHIFLSLTNLGEGTQNTRRRVLKQDLITAKYDKDLIDNVVQKLVNEKLIVTRNRVEQNLEIGQQAEVEVAHEALIRNWILLRQWLDECRDLLRQQRKIEDAAQEWKSSGKKTDYLLSKKRLKEVKDFQKKEKEKYPLSKLATDFVSVSIKYQRLKQIKALGIFFIIPLIGTVIGGYLLFREYMIQADLAVVRNCEGKRDCFGRIKALERLVKAKVSLKSANLDSANLQNAYLDSANLQNANLKAANLQNANLRDANLRDANLDSANLQNANLNHAINLTNEQIKLACNWEKANFAKVKIEELKEDKASDPQYLPNCDRWK